MGFLGILDRLTDAVVSVVRAVCIVIAAAIFVIVILAVIARYGLGQAVSWTEEVPRYLLIWVSFLGAAVCVLKREHVGFEVLLNALPEGLRRVVSVGIDLLILGFGWIMLRYGIVFVNDFGSDLMETLPYTNVWYYSAMPVSGALMMFFAFKLVIDDLVGRRSHGGGATVD